MPPSPQVLDHLRHPRNVGSLPKSDARVGTGLVRSDGCGSVLRLSVLVDPATSTIADARFKAFGCSAAIAVGSLVTVRLQGLSLDRAREVRAATLANDLALAEDRYHCAELGERAVLAAVSDYLNRRPTAQ